MVVLSFPFEIEEHDIKTWNEKKKLIYYTLKRALNGILSEILLTMYCNIFFDMKSLLFLFLLKRKHS